MPDRFAIVFELDGCSCRAFAETGSRIVIAKHGSEGGGNVAWLAWEPSGSDTVEWAEAYGLYAAGAVTRDGDVVPISCTLPSAVDRSIYSFTGSAFEAREPAPHVPAHHYDVRNATANAVTLGLLQSATVNGTDTLSAVNAVVVPPSFTADFAALTTVSVWVQPGVESGSIVRIPPTATVLPLDAGNSTIRYRYDPGAARFVASVTDVPGELPAMQQQTQWSAELALTPMYQTYDTYCGPACAQMILSVLGYPPRPMPAQWSLSHEMNDPVHALAGLQIGDPYGLAYTVTHPPNQPASAAPQTYGVIRANEQKDALAPVVRALLSPDQQLSAACVLAGGHWIAVYGGDGTGDPNDGTLQIDNLWICNPDNGWFPGGNPPGPLNPAGLSYIEEHITYGAFLSTYFTSAAAWYSDGLGFVAVCNMNALTGGQTPPPPAPQLFSEMKRNRSEGVPQRGEQPAYEPLAAHETLIDSAIEAVRQKGLSYRFEGVTPGKPRLVQRLERSGHEYHLIPFVRKDGYANVVRLDAAGRYLGAAFGIPYTDLYGDRHAERWAAQLFADTGDEQRYATPRTEERLVWYPSLESKTPYNPFYRVRVGDRTAYVSLGGRVAGKLHQLLTHESLSLE